MATFDDDATLSGEVMLLVALAVTVVMQCSFFAIAFLCQFDKVTDLAGTLNFLTLALLSLVVQNVYATRGIVVTALVSVWALRLGSHLLRRVLQRGNDARFDEMRANCCQFFGFWIFQIVWVFIVSLPVVLVHSTDDAVDAASSSNFGTAQDIVGVVLWAIGFGIEWSADATKEAFYKANATNNDRKAALLQSGVWRYSRHPNYFGEILCWVGVTIVSTTALPRDWMVVVSSASPILTAVLLLFVSGIPMAEARYNERFGLDPAYLAYKQSTSPLVCLPPTLYRRIPLVVKQVLLCEFPLYSRKLRELQQSEQKQQSQEGGGEGGRGGEGDNSTTTYQSIP